MKAFTGGGGVPPPSILVPCEIMVMSEDSAHYGQSVSFRSGFALGHTPPGNTAFAHIRVPLAMENGQWSPQMGYFDATHSVNPGRVGALKHCTVHMHR